MSSSDSELNVTPEAVRLVAEGLNSELLPQKSKERCTGSLVIYQKTLLLFLYVFPLMGN
jgi:hypothetical protein